MFSCILTLGSYSSIHLIKDGEAPRAVTLARARDTVERNGEVSSHFASDVALDNKVVALLGDVVHRVVREGACAIEPRVGTLLT